MKKRIMEDEALIAKLRRDREEGKITWKTTGVYVEYAPMLKGEFVNIRKSLNLKQYKLSQVISTTSRAIQSYEQGIASVPGPVARMMRLMKENALYRAIMLHDIMSFKKDNPDIKAITKEFNNILKMSAELKTLQDKLKTTIEQVEKHLGKTISNMAA